jgi:hypothetical protein
MTRTKSTGAYDRAFQNHVVDNGVYFDAYEGILSAEPNSWEDLTLMLAQARPRRADAHAAKKNRSLSW